MNKLAAFGVAAIAWLATVALLWGMSRVALEYFVPAATGGHFFGKDRLPTRDITGKEVLVSIASWIIPLALAYWALRPADILRANAEAFFTAPARTPMAAVFAAIGVIAGLLAAIGAVLAIAVAAAIWLIFGGLLYAAAVAGGVMAISAIKD